MKFFENFTKIEIFRNFQKFDQNDGKFSKMTLTKIDFYSKFFKIMTIIEIFRKFDKNDFFRNFDRIEIFSPKSKF